MKFITGKPEKSGNYAVRWNGEEGGDDGVEYAPESFKELGQ